MPNTRGRINSKAAINKIKIESLPYFYFSGNSDILPYGNDNFYPSRIVDARRKSPTASGCTKRWSEFIFGNGLKDGKGLIVVNRDGETLNDIIEQVVRHGYCSLYGFGLHFNFNSLGQICEIFFVDLEYVRKHRSLDKVDYGIWREKGQYYTEFQHITVDLYDHEYAFEKIKQHGIQEYKGQLYFYAKDRELYPTAPIDSVVISASYEKESQIYPYANIKNGFSGNTIIKMPSLAMGEDAQKEVDTLQENIESMHGSEQAGSSLVVPIELNKDGEVKDFKMIEHLSPTNVDGLFTNQNLKAENDILKVFNMPKVLLGVSDSGMFNQASFNDAFNYKNEDCEFDRKIIERQFNEIITKTIWSDLGTIEMNPLNMKGAENTIVAVDTVKKDSTTENENQQNKNISPEQAKAQANLKGSVGGVQGILSIQEKFSSGITDFGSALSILKLIYGFSDEEARDLLGNPERKTEKDARQPTI